MGPEEEFEQFDSENSWNSVFQVAKHSAANDSHTVPRVWHKYYRQTRLMTRLSFR